MNEQWKQQIRQKVADSKEPAFEVPRTEMEKALSANRRQRRRVGMWYGGLAAAAMLLLIVGIGFLGHLQPWGDQVEELERKNPAGRRIMGSHRDAVADEAVPIIVRMASALRQGGHVLLAMAEKSTDEPQQTTAQDTLQATDTETAPQAEQADTARRAKPLPHGRLSRNLYRNDFTVRPSTEAHNGKRLTVKVYMSNTYVGSSSYFSSSTMVPVPGEINGKGNISNTENGHSGDSSGGGDSQPPGGHGSTGGENGSTDGEHGSTGGDDDEEETRATAMASQRTEEVKNERRVTHRQPLRLGFSVRWGIAQRWSVESGLSYARLTTDIDETTAGKRVETEQSLVYIGVPLGVSFSLLETRRFNVYVSASGMVEKMVKGARLSQGQKSSVSIRPLQFSFYGAVGAEYRFANHLSFYLEQGASYYLDSDISVPTFYQDKKFSPNLSVGLRLDLK